MAALIKLGAFIEDISGKVGGTIFSRNKGGAYAKNRVVPLNPQSSAQNLVRSKFASLSQNWKNLDEEQRAAWNAITSEYQYVNRLGEQKTLSGKALFQKLNENLLNIDEATIDNPLQPEGTNGIISEEDSLSILQDAGGTELAEFNWTLNVENPDGNSRYVIEATKPLSAGVSNPSGRFRKIDVVDETTATIGIGAGSNYVDKFGLPPIGSKVFVRIKPVNVDTGENGSWYSGSTIVGQEV